MRSGNVTGVRIEPYLDSTTDSVILDVVFSDPDDTAEVEWVQSPGDDSAPQIGSRVFVTELSSGYLVASSGNDGTTPTATAGGKEIYSTDENFVKQARVILLPDGTLQLTNTTGGSIKLDLNGNIDILVPSGKKITVGNGTDEVLSLINDNLTEVIAGLKFIRDTITFSNGGGPTGPPANGALLSPIITNLETTQTALGNIKA